MPVYSFKDKITNEIFDVTLRISDYDNYVTSNPDVERYIDSVPSIVGGVGGIKSDNGFKEVLSKVAEAHPNSALANKTVSRTTSQVRTDNVKKKHGILT